MEKGAFGHISAFISVLLPLFTLSSFSLISELLSPLEILLLGIALSIVLLKFVSPSHLRLGDISAHMCSVLSGALIITLPFFFSYMALGYANADTLGFFISCSPALCAVTAAVLRIYRKESGRAFGGAVFGVVGCFLLTIFRGGVLSISVLGSLYSLGAAVSIGVGLLCLRRLLGVGRSIGVIRRVLFFGLVFSIPLAKIMDFDPKRYMSLIEPYVIVNLLYCAVLVPCISLCLFAFSQRMLGLMSSSCYMYAFPAMACVIYAVSVGASVGAIALVGVVLSVVGVALTSMRN